ncbi:hypothetical protein B0J11DRAFT_602435 [Dendryphion nanum]|uniref:Uncharacterized protein n=1 Tax=Dendryphion nanum TaxID=256645 RepID=A0A9P9IRW1_9PLEO|nr:hypothetical protein B0J11DRAFT_602435 [Dendryphion nanum]
MRFLIFAIAAFATGVFSAPAPQADPIRILPSNWEWDIADLKGPGCPDLNYESGWKTRYNYGQNTMDGSEIYFTVFAYPYLNASIPAGQTSASVWCETTLKYTEFSKPTNGVRGPPASDYRLRPHKNGTLIGALYDLDEGVTAEWKFTYHAPAEKKVVDSISFTGPLKNKYQSDNMLNTPFETRNQWEAPECGATTVKFRIDLAVTADKAGKKGTATSEPRTDANGNPANYGTWVGVSFDFEKCT